MNNPLTVKNGNQTCVRNKKLYLPVLLYVYDLGNLGRAEYYLSCDQMVFLQRRKAGFTWYRHEP